MLNTTDDTRFIGYEHFARRVIEQGVIEDPWFEGAPRLGAHPYVLKATRLEALYAAVERVGSVYHELVRLCLDREDWLDSFFNLMPWQRAMWATAAPLWHVFARADVFFTREGLAFTELNSDTPTGAPEASVLGQLVAPEHPTTMDPNARLGERYCEAVERFAQAVHRGRPAPRAPGPPCVGIVFPTEYTEDHSLVRLYAGWFHQRGYRTTYGSPFNLALTPQGQACLFDVPVDILVRHYKTDWWGERASAWLDDALPDREPLVHALTAAFESSLRGQTAVVNPFGAIVPQNKRSMALMWERIGSFSAASQATIRSFIPVTYRLEVMHEEQLFAEKADWVLKSDYGAEGDEVILGRYVPDAVWKQSVRLARPGHWVAQRYFDAERNEFGETVNYGVFLAAGQACGVFARSQLHATDDHAISAPVLVRAG